MGNSNGQGQLSDSVSLLTLRRFTHSVGCNRLFAKSACAWASTPSASVPCHSASLGVLCVISFLLRPFISLCRRLPRPGRGDSVANLSLSSSLSFRVPRRSLRYLFPSPSLHFSVLAPAATRSG